MNKLKRELKWWTNKAFFRSFRYRRIERRHLRPHYTEEASPSTGNERMVIIMGDGRRYHGGLADRLRAIVSVFSLCRSEGIRFAVRFTFPFELEKYLSPADYDWTLKPGEFTMNSHQARPYFTDNIGIGGPRETKWEISYLKKHVFRSPFSQIHLYCPFAFVSENFSEVFHTLFKPSPLLERALAPHRQQLNINGGGICQYLPDSWSFWVILSNPNQKRRLRMMRNVSA